MTSDSPRQRLLERERELAALDAALGRCASGAGQLVVVEGPAGIGKTELLKAAREGAGDAFLVLTANAVELEVEHPFGVVWQLLEHAGVRLPRAQWDGGAPLYDQLHRLYWILAEVAEAKRVLVTVDDVQWCDAPSLRFLAYVANRLEDLSVTLVVSLRFGETSPLLDALIGHRAARRLQPAPLSDSAIAQLLADQLGRVPDPAFAAACSEGTNGNPFLLNSLVGTIRSQHVEPSRTNVDAVARLVPPEVTLSVQRRIAHAHAAGRHVAAAVAILGREATLERVAVLSERPLHVTAAAVDALAMGDILDAGDPLTFCHPVVAAVVYDSVPAMRRAEQHRRAATLLLAQAAPPATVATHLVHSPATGDAAAVTVLREAARQAAAAGDNDVAVRLLQRALREPPRSDDVAEVLYELGSAEIGIDPEEAVEHLLAAGRRSRDQDLRARAALAAAGPLSMRGHLSDAIALLEDAMQAVADAELQTQLQIEMLALARFDPSARHMLDDDRSAPAAHDAAPRLLAFLAQERLFANDSAADVAQLARRAWDDRRLLTSAGADDPVYYHAVGALMYTGHHGEAETALLAADDQARSRGSIFGHVHVAASLLALDVERGRVVDAVEEGHNVLRLLLDLRWDLWVPFVAAYLVEALVEHAEVQRAWDVLSECRLHADVGPLPAALWALRARGVLRLQEGRLDEALNDFIESGKRQADVGMVTPAVAPWRPGAAFALAGLGRTGEARALAAEELSLAEAFGASRPIGVALRVGGVVDGDVASLREACDVLSGCDAPVEHARALTDLGSLLRRRHRLTEAREPLAAALDIAHSCGAHALAERAHTELVATGARPRRRAQTGEQALTVSERRVAEMAADGRTNRQIAQALFVSTKTVEKHLRGAFRKLGVSARHDLARTLPPR